MWEWFQRLAQPPPLGGPPSVNGFEFLTVCQRYGWDEDVAFYLLDRLLSAYAERAETTKT